MKRVYIAHPLGQDPTERAANRRRAKRWFMWAAEQGVAPQAPWILLSEFWDETHRDQGMAIDLATVEGCDEVWLCGPRISPGMLIESDHGIAHCTRVAHYPEMSPEAAWEIVNER